MTTNAVKAVSAGVIVEATLSDATGPQIHVTGTSGTLNPVTDVCASRLMPLGWNSALEKNGFCPCASAVAGHWKNHRNSAGSPQPHRVWVVTPSTQACTHRRNPSARYSTPAVTRVIHGRHRHRRAWLGACSASFERACRGAGAARQHRGVPSGRPRLVVLLLDVDRPDVVVGAVHVLHLSMAGYMEWSWLLYLCIPLRPTGWMLGASVSIHLRMVSTFAL